MAFLAILNWYESNRQSTPRKNHREKISINIDSNPTEAEIFIFESSSGTYKRLGITPRDHEFPRTVDSFRLRLKKSCFKPLDTTLTVFKSNGKFIFKLKPEKTRLTITSSPSGADVYEGEKLIGTTGTPSPSVIEGCPGEKRVITLKKTGCADRTETLDFLQNDTTITFRLDCSEPHSQFASVWIESVPTEAEVQLREINHNNQRPKNGNTPFFASDLQAGHYEIIIKKEFYRDSTLKIDLQPGEDYQKTVHLIERTGTLLVRITPMDSVWDGEKWYPNGIPRKKLRIGPQEVAYIHSRYGKWEERIFIKENTINELYINYEDEGRIKFDSKPRGAVIIIDRDTLKVAGSDSEHPNRTTPIGYTRVRVGLRQIRAFLQGCTFSSIEINVSNRNFRDSLTFEAVKCDTSSTR